MLSRHLTTTGGPYFDSSHRFDTTRFKVKVIASTITHIWALGTICYKTTYLPTITKNYGILKLKGFFKHDCLASEYNLHRGF
jgi:hypothetical protein